MDKPLKPLSFSWDIPAPSVERTTSQDLRSGDPTFSPSAHTHTDIYIYIYIWAPRIETNSFQAFFVTALCSVCHFLSIGSRQSTPRLEKNYVMTSCRDVTSPDERDGKSGESNRRLGFPQVSHRFPTGFHSIFQLIIIQTYIY